MPTVARVVISIGRPIAVATLLFVALGLATVLGPMRSMVPAAFAADPQSVDFTVNGTTSEQPQSGEAPLAVNFAGSSTGEPTSWAWTFGDGSHASLTRADLITVTQPRPELAAVFRATGTTFIAGRPVAFNNTSTGDPKHVTWTFGDGAESTEYEPTHTYATAGTFTVTLTVRAANATSTATQTVF